MYCLYNFKLERQTFQGCCAQVSKSDVVKVTIVTIQLHADRGRTTVIPLAHQMSATSCGIQRRRPSKARSNSRNPKVNHFGTEARRYWVLASCSLPTIWILCWVRTVLSELPQ